MEYKWRLTECKDAYLSVEYLNKLDKFVKPEGIKIVYTNVCSVLVYYYYWEEIS